MRSAIEYHNRYCILNCILNFVFVCMFEFAISWEKCAVLWERHSAATKLHPRNPSANKHRYKINERTGSHVTWTIVHIRTNKYNETEGKEEKKNRWEIKTGVKMIFHECSPVLRGNFSRRRNRDRSFFQ